MNIIYKNNMPVALIDKTERIKSVQDALDMMVTARYESDCTSMVVFKESLSEEFFDLKTRVAGEILQKFSNYRMRLAIIGDFSVYKSKSLKDFIYECNKGALVFFKPSLEAALDALTIK